jgi:hypothetical protein
MSGPLRSLHTEALCWLRYGKRLPIVCTEGGPWHADVLGLSDKMTVEVEIKKSRSDLQAEFRNKKAKHYVYANAEKGPASFVPNYFYFYVPQALGEYTVKVIEELCPKAGVAVQLDTTYMDGKNTQVIRKPTRLRPDPPRPGFIRTAMMRMSSELCGSYVSANEGMGQAIFALERIYRSGQESAVRASGALDCEDLEADQRTRAAELAYAVESIKDFGSLPQVEQQKWLEAAKRWLEAQYLNSEEWRDASNRL